MIVTIWKSQLKPVTIQEIKIPIGSKFLTAREQKNDVMVWFLCYTESELETREIIIIGTGMEVDLGDNNSINNYTYIGTGIIENDMIVWHVFDRKVIRQ